MLQATNITYKTKISKFCRKVGKPSNTKNYAH